MNSTTLSIPVQLNKNVAGAYAESLKMILQHVAEFHITIVDIISQKYNIPVDEIMKTVTSDSSYTNMLVDPKIHHFTSNEINTTTNHVISSLATTTKKTIIKTGEKKIKIKPKVAVLLTQTNTTSC
jgi:hypothetical protein